jgi:hypothetical protein
MFFRFYLLSGDVPYRGHNDSLCSKSNMQKLNVSKVDDEEMKKMLIHIYVPKKVLSLQALTQSIFRFHP